MQPENQLQQVIDLIEKTGDKAVVLEQGRPAYVLMRLKDYEGLILAKSEVQGLTREEMQDKINREIAIWKSDQERMGEISQQGFDLDKEWEEEIGVDWMRENRRGGTENGDLALDIPDFGDGQDELGDRDEFSDYDDEFDFDDDGRERNWEEDEERVRDRIDGKAGRDQEDEIPFGGESVEPWEQDRRRRELDRDRQDFDEQVRYDEEVPFFDDKLERDKEGELPVFDDEDDEFDVDKEMRNIERERGRKNKESRFEEDRFYVEPM